MKKGNSNASKMKIKKKLEDLIQDESGFVSKEKVMKIGLITISSLGLLGLFASTVVAGHGSHNQHYNTIGGVPAGGGCLVLRHASHASHSNHSAY